MAEAYIVAAVRTAGGRKGGALDGLASGRHGGEVARRAWSSAPGSTARRSRT